MLADWAAASSLAVVLPLHCDRNIRVRPRHTAARYADSRGGMLVGGALECDESGMFMMTSYGMRWLRTRSGRRGRGRGRAGRGGRSGRRSGRRGCAGVAEERRRSRRSRWKSRRARARRKIGEERYEEDDDEDAGQRRGRRGGRQREEETKKRDTGRRWVKTDRTECQTFF